MTDQKDSRDSDPDETSAEADDKPSTSEESAPESDAPARHEQSEREQRAARTEPARARDERRGAAASSPAGMPAARAGLIAVVALAAGAAAGWFGHVAQAKAKLRASDSAPATVGSSGVPSGPCGKWQQKICAGAGGEQSAACQQAKAATDLLTQPTCEAAIEAVPATLAKVKAARATCDNLAKKLCAELAAGSQTCTMVTERMASFPASRCQEMVANYEQVAQQVKMIDQQQGMRPMMGGSPHGAMPPGAPHSMPPGAPHGGPPSGPPGSEPKPLPPGHSADDGHGH